MTSPSSPITSNSGSGSAPGVSSIIPPKDGSSSSGGSLKAIKMGIGIGIGELGGSLNAFSVDPEGKNAVVAGREGS